MQWGGGSVKLRVRDTGYGMDKDALSKAFNPFFTTKEVGKGSGLALPTVYGLVTQHHGRIEVHSELGKGTTVECSSPARRGIRSRPRCSCAFRPQPGTRRPRGDHPGGGGQRRRATKCGARTLLRDGYRVLATGSPDEALRLMRDLREGPALVISDVVMPVMNGRELVAELRRRQPTLPVLLISGYSDAVENSNGHPQDVELLEKPLDVQTLRLTVRKLVERAR